MDSKKAIEKYQNMIRDNPEASKNEKARWELVIEVLEKQIPKKPNNFDGYYCRNCNGKLARQTNLVYQKYCHHCGQKICWR